MILFLLRNTNGRGGGIRTPDPLLPKQMRYQTALRPDIFMNCTVAAAVPKRPAYARP